MPRRSDRRRWTPEEDEQLRQLYMTTPYTKIARQLGRTEMAILDRAARLGLRRHDRPGFTPAAIARLLRVSQPTVKRWIQRGWLRAEQVPLPQRQSYRVQPDDLVRFLKAHPDKWHARRCPNLHLALGLRPRRRDAGPRDRPLWLKEALAVDIRRRRHRQPWTHEEDCQLARLMRRQLPYWEIARLMHRTPASIANRVSALGPRLWELAKRAQ